MSNKYKIILLSVVFFSGHVVQTHAQTYKLWRDLMGSFDAQPASARAAAMGYAEVANGGTMAEARINPATLGLMPQKLQTEFGYSWPVYVDKKSNTSFVGAGYKIDSKLSVGLSRFGYSVIKPSFGFESANPANPVFFPSKVTETFYTGSASYEIIPGLYGGLSLNYFSYNLTGSGNTGSFMGDAGVLYKPKLKKPKSQKVIERNIQVAASFTNLNMATTKWKYPNGNFDALRITSHIYAGASYFTSMDVKGFVYGKSKLIGENDRTIDILLQLQYTYFANMGDVAAGKIPHDHQPIQSGESVGAEILFLKIFALRFGYRNEKRPGDTAPFGVTENATYPYVRGFTFGTGLNIPINRLTNSHLPFDLSLDYVHRNTPFKWLKSNPSLTELPTTNINLRLNWYLKK